MKSHKPGMDSLKAMYGGSLHFVCILCVPHFQNMDLPAKMCYTSRTNSKQAVTL